MRRKEVEARVSKLKNGKAADKDGDTREIIRVRGDLVMD